MRPHMRDTERVSIFDRYMRPDNVRVTFHRSKIEPYDDRNVFERKSNPGGPLPVSPGPPKGEKQRMLRSSNAASEIVLREGS